MTAEKKAEFLAKDASLKSKPIARPKNRAIDPNQLVFASSSLRPYTFCIGGGSDTAALSLPNGYQRTLDQSWEPQKKADVDVAVARFSITTTSPL